MSKNISEFQVQEQKINKNCSKENYLNCQILASKQETKTREGIQVKVQLLRNGCIWGHQKSCMDLLREYQKLKHGNANLFGNMQPIIKSLLKGCEEGLTNSCLSVEKFCSHKNDFCRKREAISARNLACKKESKYCNKTKTPIQLEKLGINIGKIVKTVKPNNKGDKSALKRFLEFSTTNSCRSNQECKTIVLQSACCPIAYSVNQKSEKTLKNLHFKASNGICTGSIGCTNLFYQSECKKNGLCGFSSTRLQGKVAVQYRTPVLKKEPIDNWAVKVKISSTTGIEYRTAFNQIQENLRPIRHCLQQLLQRHKVIQDNNLSIELLITRSGRVGRIKHIEDSFNDKRMPQCVIRKIRRFQFPLSLPENGKITLTYEFIKKR